MVLSRSAGVLTKRRTSLIPCMAMIKTAIQGIFFTLIPQDPSCDSSYMNKKLTITFVETSPTEVDISIESTDPADNINDIVALLDSTLRSLASGIEEEAE